MMLKPMLFLLVAGGLMLVLGALRASRAARKRQRRLDFSMEAARAGEKPTVPADFSEETANNHKTLEKLLLLDANHPWQLRLSAKILFLSAVAAAAAVWTLLHVAFAAPFGVAAGLSAIAAVLSARTVLAWKRAKIEAAFAASFPDAVDATVRMLRVGLPVTSAIRAVAQESPAPTNGLFLRIANQMNIGIPLADALQSASQQVRLKDFRFFCAAVILQQSCGGNLVSTLTELSQIMQKRRIMRSKARAATSEVRFTAYVLGSLPFIVIAAMLLVAPDYLLPLFTDERGHLILAAAAAGLSLAYFIMRGMMRSINAD